MNLYQDYFIPLLHDAVSAGASDVHLSAGNTVKFRIHGQIEPYGNKVLTVRDTSLFAANILVSARKSSHDDIANYLNHLHDEDCSFGVSGVGRFRVNVSRQRGSLCLVMRLIPETPPDFVSLNLPGVLAQIALENRGLVLITGATGCGKSSTLAAIINHINQNRQVKIITIEDPIEYLIRDEKASIVQREVGSDTESFAFALRAALRQDPDVIMVGEMRDHETTDIALKAAETGHLVLSTLHTVDVAKTISRIVGIFDQGEQMSVRYRLAESLRAIISQTLLPRQDRSGRIVSTEIMRATLTIKECIEDPKKTGQIRDYLEKGRDQYGMHSFDQSLLDLYRKNIISLEVAKSASSSPADFDRNLAFGA